MNRTSWLTATALCGTVDALYASAIAIVRDRPLIDIWAGVASGLFGERTAQWGIHGAIAGVAVHFALMGIMVAVYLWLARHTPIGTMPVLLAGTLYGLALYGVMYGIVLPMRFDTPLPLADPGKLLRGLFPHIALVGIPLAWLAKRANAARA